MKRLSSSCGESLGGLMSICPNATEEENPMYARELETMLDGLEEEESGQKKRRLSVDQVKALEKNFEVENKLEPERKVKLAQELGLQPRQVAVWFQNRRARWKTKQLERDYAALKATYDALKLNFDALHHDNHSLLTQIRELKSKLSHDGGGGGGEEEEEEEKAKGDAAEADRNLERGKKEGDGSSDSDSSAIVNEENQVAAAQMVKIEEHNFFGEESCSTLFSDDQPPSLHWYCNDQWD